MILCNGLIRPDINGIVKDGVNTLSDLVIQRQSTKDIGNKTFNILSKKSRHGREDCLIKGGYN